VASEGELLVIGNVLITEDENGILVHPCLDRGHLLRAEHAAAVDPGDLAGKDRMQRADRNGHRGFLRWRVPKNLKKILAV